MIEGEIILHIEGLNKYFGPTHANKNVNFDLKKGEIRGLAGENGSGKSTLVSMIAGIYRKDSGKMYKDNEEYDPGSPIDANSKKISIVVQELGLVSNLPAGVNVFLGRMDDFCKFGIVNLRKLFKAANEELVKWNLGEMPIKSLADELSVESRKIIEIARALSIDPDIIILDEVTQTLSHDNRLKIYDLIADLKRKGKSIIMISHDLEELIKLTDSITVLRDGEVVGTKDSSELTSDIVKRMMVGRSVESNFYRNDKESSYQDEVVVEVRNMYADNKLEDISFDLHKGEILAICGLSDAGIHELGKALFGLIKHNKGTIHLKSNNVFIKNPTQALKHGMAYVPKDRDGEALMLNASIRDNMCLPSVKWIEDLLGFINPLKLNRIAKNASDSYEVKCTGIEQIINNLSGGNKQKVNLGRWMVNKPKVIILDCPTRGVDVGVKAYIYNQMMKAKEEGLSIIMISDELPEAIGMADTILVLKNGRTVGVMDRNSNFTEESIIEVMI